MKPRKQYILLNGTQGSLDGNNVKFQLQPHMFRNYEANDNMTISLKAFFFSVEFESAEQTGHVHVRSDLTNRNMYDSTSSVFLASQLYKYDLVGATHYLSSAEMVYSPEIDCEPFNEITMGLYIGNVQLTPDAAEKNKMNFLFEIEYRKEE